ncbi:sulfite exporter TauE/SafE family protein [Ruminococcus gauvreauii]|uniref:Probable membrane transporter protein n=1 Tax=Ruminococcus gauvreauii TaxID=438033 RepID=A0ABY5VKB1_9FIRM|nr:sulfite exporter TauE/SafE family protein [Ruminococcus gauvreauii]UWP60488.1 sulfite exporter TauE/SafE family protein [Ruminococcus gauvreauii]
MKMTLELGILIFVAQFIGYIIKGLVGFGNPLIANPVMAMRIDNKFITPGVLPVDTCVNIYMSVKNRKSFLPRLALPIAVCIMIGVVPGILFLKVGSPWIIKALLGVLIIGLGVEMLTRKRDQEITTKNNPVIMGLISVISGFLSGLFGINMLFLAYLERRVANRQQFRANVCFIFVFENVFRLIMYAINGMFSMFTVGITLLSIPAAVFGIMIGSRIDLRLNEKTANRLINAVFILGGVSILVKALIFKA